MPYNAIKLQCHPIDMHTMPHSGGQTSIIILLLDTYNSNNHLGTLPMLQATRLRHKGPGRVNTRPLPDHEDQLDAANRRSKQADTKDSNSIQYTSKNWLTMKQTATHT